MLESGSPGLRRVAWFVAAIALGIGSTDLARGAALELKAAAAEPLLRAAWTRARIGEARPTPWPSADSWPVARLRVPRIGVDQIVLAGATGKVLAFAPGWLRGSAPPGSEGNSVIAGHRDSHFAFLEELEAGDEVVLSMPDDARRSYRVMHMEVVHERDVAPTTPSADSRLTLITCFPFDAIRPGGPLRFVVHALAASAPRPTEEAASAAGSVLASARGG